MDSRKIRFIFEPIFVSGKYYYLIQLYRWTTVKEGEKELFTFYQNASSKWFPSLERKIFKAVDSPCFSASFSSGKKK